MYLTLFENLNNIRNFSCFSLTYVLNLPYLKSKFCNNFKKLEGKNFISQALRNKFISIFLRINS